MMFLSWNLFGSLKSAQSFGTGTHTSTTRRLIRSTFALKSLSSAEAGKPSGWSNADSADKPLPMTLLAGFLGSGKTSTLKHLLENSENYKIGVIVNDVASVNIDAKLISNHGMADGVVQLDNGCACCSLADELFLSVDKLVAGRDFDAIVIELSGVADPMAIRNYWKMAPKEIRKKASIGKVVTVVDTQTFGSDYMTWDMVVDRKGWAGSNSECASNIKVSELLAEQVETADVVLLNKVDLAGEEQVEIANKVATALNEKASFIRSEFGKVSPAALLGRKAAIMEPHKDCSHSHHHAENKDSSHAHQHDDQDSVNTKCSDSTSQTHDEGCMDPACSDSSHSHSHDHGSGTLDFEDNYHSHSHDHRTSTEALGIQNYVYKASRPFNTKRLLRLLNRWPIPKKDVLDVGFWEDREKPTEDMFGNPMNDNPFAGVLRSKGFCWFAPQKWEGALEDAWRHDTAMYMSHAGRHMGITMAGKWWAAISSDSMSRFFDEDNKSDLDRILKEEFVSDEFGDRRQELVFIGVDINNKAIEEALDKCLLTDEEMNSYRQQLANLNKSTYKMTATTSSGGLS